MPPPLWEVIWQWYWHHFLKGVCFHMPLILLLVALIALPFNVVGEEFGVVQLIWHEGPFKRFLVGMALAVVALQSLFVGYLLWDRARREGRLESDPGPLAFEWFAVRTVGCLLATLTALYLMWLMVGLLGASDPTGEPDADASEQRSGWLKAAVPDPEAKWRWRVWLVALLPLGGLAAVVAVGVAGYFNLGAWLARRQLVERSRKWLLALDDSHRSDQGGWTWWQAGGVAVVLGIWAGALLTCVPRSEDRGQLALVLLTVGGTVLFLASVLADLIGPWRDQRLASVVFFLNLLAYLAIAYTWGTYALSMYGFLCGAVAAVTAVIGAVALAMALPGPADVWLSHRIGDPPAADRAPSDAVQVWPFVLLAGLLFFVPFNFVPCFESPAPIVCFSLFGLVCIYGVATVAVRRTIPAAIITLLFFTILAGVEPYKFRYDGYPDDNGGWVEGLDYRPDKLLDLRVQMAEDHKRQERFDDALREYETAFTTFNDEKQRRDTAMGIIANVIWPVVQNTKEEVDQALQELATLPARVEAARGQFREQKRILLGLWQEMETKNRVIAARTVRGDLDLDFLTQAAPGQPRLDDGKRLLRVQDWQLSQSQKDGPFVIVTVSGGGLRSAAWTFTVLRTLEEKFAAVGIDFSSHVRLITGASGGMLGASFYVSTLGEDVKRSVLDAACQTRDVTNLHDFNDDLYKQLTGDHLTPLVKQHVYGDVPSLLSPWPARHDRGKVLEEVWSKQLRRPNETRGALDKSFAELREAERTGKLPSLVFTPMMVEDGRRLILSNLDMRNAITNDGNLLREGSHIDPLGSECHSREAMEMFRLFPDAANKVRLSSATRMSASFPFFSPAVSLPVKPRRRLVDAGYYDNYGVSLAASWLISTGNRDWVMDNTAKVLLIQIRDGVDQPQRRLEWMDPEGSTGVSRSAEEMSSPVEGLYNARVGSSSFRNDSQLEILTQLFRQYSFSGRTLYRQADQVNRLFQVVNFEFQDRAALSWYLSAAERDAVSRAMRKSDGRWHADYAKRVELLQEWWQKPYKFEPR